MAILWKSWSAIYWSLLQPPRSTASSTPWAFWSRRSAFSNWSLFKYAKALSLSSCSTIGISSKINQSVFFGVLTFTKLQFFVIMLIKKRIFGIGRIQAASGPVCSRKHIRFGAPGTLCHADLLFDWRDATRLFSNLVLDWRGFAGYPT